MRSKKKLLLVNHSSEDLEKFQFDLTQLGYEVLRASDTPGVLRMVELQSPDLIVSQLQLASENAIDLCWYIRNISEHPFTPFVILSRTIDEEIELNAYRTGVDIFLTAPISFRTFLIRIEALLTRIKRIRQHFSKNPTSLSGMLDSIHLVDLIQLFHMSQKTGALWLTQKFKRGLLFFRQGNLIFAKSDTLKGEKAIFEMADWREGFFTFEDQTEEPDENVTLSTMKLILEISTRQDENVADLLNSMQSDKKSTNARP